MKKYQILTTPKFDKAIKKLDLVTRATIKKWIDNNLVNTTNPRLHGKALRGDLAGKWRYRVGKYRLIATIQDNKLIILMLSVGIRNEVYK
ncbi:MAG: type II toxin-antitoxin system RelE/ParE family toxin [Phascolarctobacterium sp.]|nr:type II toxin-antitoxin system RelE/ParE family toxin [Phascolarctobacterium sp.]